ncbi:MAG: ATP-binding cassette domain-containing protein [Acidimicrobiales bacterium]
MTLTVQNLRKTFGERVAVNDISFDIATGETYGLLGPNGAGKTTTISLICGLLEADVGSVTVAGAPVTTRAVQARARIGYVPQEIAIYPDLTARENLTFFGKLYGLKGEQLTKRLEEVLAVLGLSDRADERTENFSGGMQRRLNIGLGLLHEPELLVLDEPTVGVDPQSRNAILSAVEALSEEGLALLYTTHYMEEAERLCDRVGIMDEGKMIAEGTRRELVAGVGEHDRVQLELVDQVDLSAAKTLPGVDRIVTDGLRSDVYLDQAAQRLPLLLDAVSSAGGSVRAVEVVEPDLEAVFLNLTGKALRDD